MIRGEIEREDRAVVMVRKMGLGRVGGRGVNVQVFGDPQGC